MGKEGVLHFTITGEFITRQARELWAEGAYSKALRLLMDGLHDMTLDVAIKICTGRLKLKGANEYVHAVKDDTEDDGRGIPLVGIIEAFEALEKKDEAAEKFMHDHASSVADAYSKVVDEVRDSTRKFWNRGFDTILQKEENRLRALKAGPQRPAVKPKPLSKDKALKAMNGWLNRNGKLFGCNWYEHSTLADQLHDDGERGLEKAGWAKLSNGPIFKGWLYQSKLGHTSSQAQFIWEWCTEHKQRKPYWLKED